MKEDIKVIVVLILFFMTSFSYAYPTAKVTAKVVDDEGNPIEGVKIGCNFETAKTASLGVNVKRIKGSSDINGVFLVKGSTSSGFVSCSAKKEGYYRGGAGTGRFKKVSGIIGFRKWQPWNPTVTIILKRILNPIPMYMANIRGKALSDDPPAMLPEEGKFYGFDLIAKDWVVPYGQGLHSDFVFKIDVDHYTKKPLEYDATMTLKFTNLDDGIQSFYTPKKRGSELRSAHNAPLTRYGNKLVTRITREKDKTLDLPFRDDQNSYFRVRTTRDEQGNIIEAYYGKIYGGIEFSFPSDGEKGEIYFSYYLNPNNNDTNVEFSPEKNLFPKPKGHRGHYRFNP